MDGLLIPPCKLEDAWVELEWATSTLVFDRVVEQFGARELEDWARWFKMAYEPYNKDGFDKWWRRPCKRRSVLEILVMSGVMSSDPAVLDKVVGRLIRWYWGD